MCLRVLILIIVGWIENNCLSGFLNNFLCKFDLSKFSKALINLINSQLSFLTKSIYSSII